MYLAGYSVECLLKTKLMEKFDCRTLGDLEVELKSRGLIPGDATLYDHRIELYLSAGGGLDRMRNDHALWKSFTIMNGWLPSWRYNPDLSTRADAEVFLGAVDSVLGWVRNSF